MEYKSLTTKRTLRETKTILDLLHIAHARSSIITTNGVKISVSHSVNDLTVYNNKAERRNPGIDCVPW
jgi:hypothetical protein